jgi:hypothetical protein
VRLFGMVTTRMALWGKVLQTKKWQVLDFDLTLECVITEVLSSRQLRLSNSP